MGNELIPSVTLVISLDKRKILFCPGIGLHLNISDKTLVVMCTTPSRKCICELDRGWRRRNLAGEEGNDGIGQFVSCGRKIHLNLLPSSMSSSPFTCFPARSFLDFSHFFADATGRESPLTIIPDSGTVVFDELQQELQIYVDAQQLL